VKNGGKMDVHTICGENNDVNQEGEKNIILGGIV
jgi:hypothetical protein